MNIIDTDAHPPCGEAEVDHLGRLSPHRFFERLQRAGIDTVEDLISRTEEDMIKVRNLGKKSLEEVIQKLHSLGLELKKEEE